MTEMEPEHRAADQAAKKAKAAAASSSAGKNRIYIAHQESGAVDYFTDELEAHRFAVQGAKCSVEPVSPKGRAKQAK